MATFTVPDSIVSRDLGTDYTAAFNAFLASVPDGTEGAPNEIVCPRCAVYRIDGTLTISGEHLRVKCNRAKLQRMVNPPLDGQGLSKNPHFQILDSLDVIAEEPEIQGLNVNENDPGGLPGYPWYVPSRAFEFGFGIRSSEGCKIIGARGDQIFGDGFTLSNKTGGPHTVDSSIEDSVFDRCGRQGMSAFGVDNGAFLRVQVLHARRTGLDIEPSSAGHAVNGLLVDSCYTNAINSGISSAGQNAEVNDVTIINHTFRKPPKMIVGSSDGTMRRRWKLLNSRSLLTAAGLNWAVVFDQAEDVEVNGVIWPVSANQQRRGLLLKRCIGELKVIDSDFRNALTAYDLDAVTQANIVANLATIEAHGNLP